MKTTFSTLIIASFLMGIFLVGNALAQPSDAGSEATEAAPAPTEPALDTPTETASTAAEEPAAKAPEKALDQGQGVYENVKGGEWILAFGFLGMLLGSAGRWLVGKKWDFIKSRSGGYAIAASVGLGTLGVFIVEAGAFSASMLAPAVASTLAAMALHAPAKAVKKKLTGEAKA